LRDPLGDEQARFCGLLLLAQIFIPRIDHANCRNDSAYYHWIGINETANTGLKQKDPHTNQSRERQRHTVRANGDIVSANPSHVAAICGWANSNRPISKSMMNYGREALSRAEGFRAVRDTSIKMHQHIFDAINRS